MQHDVSNSEMACFLYVEQYSDPQFRVTYRAGVPFVTHHNYDGVYQIVVPKSHGFHELLIIELHVTPLASYLGI